MAEMELVKHLREHVKSRKVRNIEKRHGNLDEWKEFAEGMRHG